MGTMGLQKWFLNQAGLLETAPEGRMLHCQESGRMSTGYLVGCGVYGML